MVTKLIQKSDKLISSIATDNTVVVKEFDTWIQGSVIEHLNYTQLEVVYSIPTGIDNPTVSDINGVYLINCAGIIIAEQVGLACSENSVLLQVVEDLLASLEDKVFTLIIESNRNNNKGRHEQEVHAVHMMLAITAGFEDIINTVYNEAVEDGEIEKAVARCVQHEKRMEVNLENGNVYKLLSISIPLQKNE